MEPLHPRSSPRPAACPLSLRPDPFGVAPPERVRTIDANTQELLNCSGAGIACAIAAAFPHAYLAEGGGTAGGAAPGPVRPPLPPFPADVLEFDFRGRMDVGRDYAYIDIGEVKSSLDLSSAVQQLGVRLGVLRWLLANCCGVPDAGVRAVGRLFVPSGVGGATPRDASQEEVASSLWGFSLYMHRP